MSYYSSSSNNSSSGSTSQYTSSGTFIPHTMYDPNTGQAYNASTEALHLQYVALGYVHSMSDNVDITNKINSEIPVAQARAATTEPNSVSGLVPVHLREGAQNFIDLLEDYYTYLNTDGLPSQEINNILVEQDIDRTSIQYLDSIQKEIAMNVPDAVAFDRVSLYKKIVKYYLTKGSRDSILTFFKIFYDEAVVVSYPRELLFAPSQGNYDPNIDRYLDGKGFPSGTDKVQDSYFWQNFSYVIESALPVENWKSNFLNLVHPAGFKFFGIIAILMVRSNKWIGRHVIFDEVTRKYILTDDYDVDQYNNLYQTKELSDLDWMEGLIPPALLTTVDRYSFNEGYHTPTFQFGLVPLETLINILIIKELDDDRFNLFIEVILNYVITEDGNHFLRGRDSYLQDVKFLDRDGFSEFKDRLIGESLDDSNLLSQRIFHQVSSYVKSEISVIQETGRSIARRVNGLTPSNTTKDLFTQESYNSDLKFVRNEECWAKDIKGITAISPWNSRQDNRRAGIAISPRHVLFVEHSDYNLEVGDTIYFVTRNNITISRQIIQEKDHPATGFGFGDFNVALLDSPLPDDIEIIKLLPRNSYNYFPIDLYNAPNDLKFGENYTDIDIPYIFHTDQEEKACILKLNTLNWYPASGTDNSPDTGYGIASYINDTTGLSSTSEWGETVIAGDSGNPVMMLLKGEAVLISMFTTSTSGPFVSQERNFNDINQMIEDVNFQDYNESQDAVTSFVFENRTYNKDSGTPFNRPSYSGLAPSQNLSWNISWDGAVWRSKLDQILEFTASGSSIAEANGTFTRFDNDVNGLGQNIGTSWRKPLVGDNPYHEKYFRHTDGRWFLRQPAEDFTPVGTIFYTFNDVPLSPTTTYEYPWEITDFATTATGFFTTAPTISDWRGTWSSSSTVVGTILNDGVNTPYPWQTRKLSTVLPNYTSITPSLNTFIENTLTEFDFKSENRVEIFTPVKIAEGVDTSFTAAEGYSTTPNDYTSSHPDWEGRPFTDSSPQEFPDQWFNDPANGRISCSGLFKNIRTAKPLNARVGDIVKASVDFDFGNTANQADDERTFMLSLSDIGSYLDADEGVLNHSDLSFFIKFTENNNGFAQAKLMLRVEGAADTYVGALGLNAAQNNIIRLELELDVKSSAATTTVKVSYENVTDSVSMANNPVTITGVDSVFYNSLIDSEPKIRMNLQAGELTDTLIGTMNVYDASFKNLVSFDTEQLSELSIQTTSVATDDLIMTSSLFDTSGLPINTIPDVFFANSNFSSSWNTEDDDTITLNGGPVKSYGVLELGIGPFGTPTNWTLQYYNDNAQIIYAATAPYNNETSPVGLTFTSSTGSGIPVIETNNYIDVVEVSGSTYDTSATHIQIEDTTVGSFQASGNPVWAYPGPHPAFDTYIRQPGLFNGKPRYFNVVPDDGSFDFGDNFDYDPSGGAANHEIYWSGSAWIASVNRSTFSFSETIHTRDTPEPWIESDGSISSDFDLQYNTRFNGKHKLYLISSDKLSFKRPNDDTSVDSFTAKIELSKLDKYIAPSKYKKYTENIQQIRDKFSEDSP